MPQPLINDVLPLTQIVAGNNQTVYSTNWTANAAADVVVYDTPVGQPPSDVTDFVNPNLYTVQFIGQLQQVQVTFNSAPIQNDIITITRTTPVSRQNLYTNTNFSPSMLNQDFALFTLEIQENDLVNQQVAPRYNYSAVVTQVVDTILPILGANQIWAKNNANTAIIPLNVPSQGFAPADASYVLLSSDGLLTNSFALNSLGNGFLVNLPGTPTVINRQILGATNQINILNGTGFGGDLVVSIPANPIMPGTAGMGIPIGTTAQRVIPASNINLRFNTDLFSMEFWDGSDWSVIASGGSVTVLTQGTGIILTPNPITDTGTIALNVAAMPAFTMAGTINMNNNSITNLADPVNPQDATNKRYVDLNSLTGTSVYAATTASSSLVVTQSGAGVGATLTNAGTQATFALDGSNPPLNTNVLVKDVGTGYTSANLGIYTVTNAGSVSSNWVLTRATFYDTASEINRTGLIVIQNGTTESGTAWYNTNTITTVDTSAFNYAELGNIVFPVTVPHGGTGLTSMTAYGILAGGTTSIGNVQQLGLGLSGQVLQSNGSSALASFSTATYPSTTTINQLLYSSAANIVTGLATANSSVLVTSAGGVPSLSTTLPAGLTIPTPKMSQINDANGNEILLLNPTASAVNYIEITNAATTTNPIVSAKGSDTNIALLLQGQGNAGALVQGASTNTAIPAGYKGETIFSEVLFASAVSLMTSTNTNITSILLTPGSWKMSSNVFLNNAGGSFTVTAACINTASATFTGTDNAYISQGSGNPTWGTPVFYPTVHISTNTTYYLNCIAGFSAGAATACGRIEAERI